MIFLIQKIDTLIALTWQIRFSPIDRFAATMFIDPEKLVSIEVHIVAKDKNRSINLSPFICVICKTSIDEIINTNLINRPEIHRESRARRRTR